MQKLESLLTERETAIAVDFDHLKHRVRCYAHIINICSSHVISSITSVSKLYISKLKVPVDSNFIFCGDSENELDDDDDDDDTGRNIDDLELDCYDDKGKSNLKHWFAGIKRDPLRCAHRVIHLLRSSDLHRENFRIFIQDRNTRKWFYERTQSGKRNPVQVPELQLLRDVKTRWDLVYSMLQRLRVLRPISSSHILRLI
jgi:hypothetical protein